MSEQYWIGSHDIPDWTDAMIREVVCAAGAATELDFYAEIGVDRYTAYRV